MRVGGVAAAAVCLSLLAQSSVQGQDGLPGGPAGISPYGKQLAARGRGGSTPSPRRATGTPSRHPLAPQMVRLGPGVWSSGPYERVVRVGEGKAGPVFARKIPNGWDLVVRNPKDGRQETRYLYYDPRRHGPIEGLDDEPAPTRWSSKRKRGAAGVLRGDDANPGSDDPSKPPAYDVSRPELIGPQLTGREAAKQGLDTKPLQEAFDRAQADPSAANDAAVQREAADLERVMKAIDDAYRELTKQLLLSTPFEDLSNREIEEYFKLLETDPVLKKRREKALDYAARAAEMLKKLGDAEADAESYFTFPWNVDSYKQKAKDLKAQLKALEKEYGEEVGNDLLVIDRSRPTDDMWRFTGGGYGLGGALDGYLEARTPYNDGLEATYDEMLFIPTGLLTKVAAGKAMARWTAARVTAASVKDKLGRYLLNAAHPKGGPKAAWFKQALGFTAQNMKGLAKQIKFNPKTAVQTGVTQFGTKFNQTIAIKGANGKVIPVVFAWLKHKDGAIKLVTAIPTKR